ncbi:uncharacterized protein BXZ73DRAFT_87319 [Epithele typhae]|uniref:uncharacterized protein n=1 Tax=Epithele typhae TaxID=378194 RepID=UPI0020075CD3|nr:uncharacterized protein BXZ73DRAFT_87319 [Epithele typhae]KAH9944415.1 hypothetical protein BXZ73DRAFT_87319 [Epithele typhae]
MDGSRPGEAGVITWCNSLRLTMAKDSGRQFLHEQIQTEGFDFLDMYLENFLDGPRKEPVLELLKTPGRKKKAPTTTRSAVAAASKVQAVVSLPLEDGDAKENHGPINDFHKALLQVKDTKGKPKDVRDSETSRQPSEERPRPKPPAILAKLKTQRVVTVADSPAPEPAVEIRDTRPPLPSLPLEEPSPVHPPVHQAAKEDTAMEQVQQMAKELSMIEEDDELAERSRASFTVPPPAPSRDPNPTPDAMGILQPQNTIDPPSPDVMMEDELDIAPSPEPELQPADTTAASAHSFHDVPLSPQVPQSQSTSAHTAEFHTAPLPRVSIPPVPVEEEQYSHTAPLPATFSTVHEEFTVPLRDEPSAPVPGLSRKPSLAHFTGLPAPSPLRKSLRPVGDTATVPTAQAAAPAALGKRSSTSWLSKARETKALEITNKRSSTFGAAKRKSGEMLDAAHAVLRSLEEEERAPKTRRLSKSPEEADDEQSGKSQEASSSRSTAPPVEAHADENDTDVFTMLFKKKPEPRPGKSMGKSLGGIAAAALAEARAAAEVRVAERHKIELGVSNKSEDAAMDPEESSRRLSVSDLVPTSQGKGKEKSKDVPVFSLPTPAAVAADTSSSTTPPTSPPPSRNNTFIAPSGPVFSKPPAASTVRKDAPPGPPRDFKLPTTNPFSIPAAMALGMGTKFQPLSAQSSKASIFSDVVFDRQDNSPGWLPSTQDTSYSAAQSQSQSQGKTGADEHDELGDDDSWGMDEKFGPQHQWTPYGFTSANPDGKDDSMTWSTLPSQSTGRKGGDTTGYQPTQPFFTTSLPRTQEEEEQQGEEDRERGFAERLADAAREESQREEEAMEEADVAMEMTTMSRSGQTGGRAGCKPTVKLVQQASRSDSQQSMASMTSSASSSQDLGFFGQASKLVSSVLGGGKKVKPEVKSLQLAAAAAKRQQEEQDKKTTRLKEMENRRQQAMQRKADEEKARAQEEERKIKEDAERRKREREEHTDKRPIRPATSMSKRSEDDTMKRKLNAPAAQKPPSKEKKEVVPPRQTKPPSTAAAKSALKPALKQPAAGPSSNPVTPGAPKTAATKTVRHVPSANNLKAAAAPATGKGKAKEPAPAAGPSRPTAPAAAAPGPPRVASETIELPDINSEYSDSEDEDRPRRDLPDWAKSPDIAAALRQQSTMNPDDIFGAVAPLRMEDIFKTRHSRFRARTSSANWAGPDELTAAEEREYARRMGFK